MSSFEEQKSVQEDLFAQAAPKTETAFQQSMETRERENDATRQALLAQSMMIAPEPAPHIQAEIPQDGAMRQEAADRLFQHYAERGAEEEEGEEEEPPSTLHVDVRQTSRDMPAKTKELGDMFSDGMDADFVADSAIVAADLDVMAPPDAGSAFDDSADAWNDRRRRGELAGSTDPLSPLDGDKDKKGEGKR